MRRAPPRKFHAIAIMAFFAAEGAARAEGDDERQTHECQDAVDPDDPGRLNLSWLWGDDDDLLPILTLRTPDAADLSYRVDLRLVFGADDWTWSQDVLGAEPLSQVDVDLDPDGLQSWSEQQDDWTSTLLVRVVTLDADNIERTTQAAPSLRVVWVDGTARLLTAVAAAEWAPQGAWSAAAQLDNPTAGWTDAVYEVGHSITFELGGEE